MKLRDKFWLWGHPEGCYNNMYGNTGISRMTPMEACLYLGVRNTFMVPDGQHENVKVNNRQYNKSDYIPCIAWGRNAKYAESLNVGDNIIVKGRIQSREYQKKISETETETKTAYEVSVSRLEIAQRQIADEDFLENNDIF